jgi:hypothetical protein
LLVPLHSQGWVAVSVVGNVSGGGNSRHGFDQLANSVDARIPFFIKFLFVNLQPCFKRSQAADDFFLADFHGTANSAFARAAIQQSGFDKVFAAQQTTARPIVPCLGSNTCRSFGGVERCQREECQRRRHATESLFEIFTCCSVFTESLV